MSKHSCNFCKHKAGLFEITLEASWRYIKGKLTDDGNAIMAEAMREEI